MKNIRNDEPVIGPYHVGKEGSNDMYAKGSNMLHMLRTIIQDDAKFRAVLLGLNKEFYHQTVTTHQIETYISQHTGIDFSKMFEQYLRQPTLFVFEYRITKGKLEYRYTDCIHDFCMPLKITAGSKLHWINPTTRWQKLTLNDNLETITVAEEFYIKVKKAE